TWRDNVAAVARWAFKKAAKALPAVIISDVQVKRLIDLARLPAAGGAPVTGDGYTKIIKTTPEPEGPTRLVQQFAKLLRGLCAAWGRVTPGSVEMAIIAKVARDTIPKI